MSPVRIINIFSKVMLGFVIIATLVQLAFPAPRWSAICGGTTCGTAQQQVIAQQESDYNHLVRIIDVSMLGLLILVGIFFWRNIKLRSDVLISAGVLAIYPYWRLSWLEFGRWPSIWLIAAVTGLGICGTFLSGRKLLSKPPIS